MGALAILIGLVIATYQMWVSILIFRAVEYTGSQKLVQIILVWLFPVLGAVLLHFLMIDTSTVRSGKDRKVDSQNENHPDYPPFLDHRA
jgi:hypothetical protein